MWPLSLRFIPALFLIHPQAQQAERPAEHGARFARGSRPASPYFGHGGRLPTPHVCGGALPPGMPVPPEDACAVPQTITWFVEVARYTRPFAIVGGTNLAKP